MAVARRKISRTTRKTTSTNASVAARRKTTVRKPVAVGEDRLLRALQQGLFNTLSSAEGEGRSPIGVAAVFVQLFLQLTKVQAVALYVRDEQTREMVCLAEAGSSDPSMTELWQEGLKKAEQQAQVVSGELHGVRLHRINRLDGVVMFQAGKSQRLPARKLLSLLTA
ncbi:MAG TPA: hypothetical protein PKW52_07765, partial [Nitrospira sp.]|nr:hypothetical protein [Nitrospira sp.]